MVIIQTKFASRMKDHNPNMGKCDFTEVNISFTTDFSEGPISLLFISAFRSKSIHKIKRNSIQTTSNKQFCTS